VEQKIRQIWAIVPVKRLESGKSRLGDAPWRRNLSLAMADTTIAALTAWDKIAGVICITSDPAVRRAAIQSGADIIDDPDAGLNEAFNSGIVAARNAGASHLLLIHADFIRLDLQELDGALAQFLENSRDGSADKVGLVRSHDGAGTNAVLVRADSQFQPQFGENSFRAHRKTAGAKFLALSAPGVAHDIDTPADLDAALSLGGAAAPIMRALDQIANPASSYNQRLETTAVEKLVTRARRLRDAGFGNVITYSPKVFIPLTELCRDTCHYCTFAKTPRRIAAPYMTIDRVLNVARQGARAGCQEALFTLGDRPEDRYGAAREWLNEKGYASTVDYLIDAAKAVRDETGLLPHINAGRLTPDEMARLHPVSASMGLMLEGASERLCAKGGPHFGSPDKKPAVRLAVIAEAGRQHIPFTTGILIGIGETRTERIEALHAIADLHDRYGHIQEIIIQNFLPKPGSKMAGAPPAPLDEIVWTIAAARNLFGSDMSIQAPPNLNANNMGALIDAGINDWGGVSPVTPDFVNPEAPWPKVEALVRAANAAGKELAPRLTIYPEYIRDAARWVAPTMKRFVLEHSDSAGLAREDSWRTGRSQIVPANFGEDGRAKYASTTKLLLDQILDFGADDLSAEDIAPLFSARGADFREICAAADDVRAAANGDIATYVFNRNINYTNICSYRCSFCAFSKGGRRHNGAEKPYLLDLDEIGRRASQAWAMGASEVCLQGGIHPNFTGETYLAILNAVKDATPAMHIHAFSPLEISHGAATLGMALDDYLALLRDNGLGSLPGTAAEILHDPIRRIICPDKLTTNEWLAVLEAAHGVGLPTTSTIMFGHIDNYRDWALHLLRLRALQARTGGITEFVPLPFVAFEAPIYKRGEARAGPTLRESVLMHAVARLVLYPLISNVQASWVKLGCEGMKIALQSGANDFGGTLINESITRAAGAQHGQMMSAGEMDVLATSLGRRLVRRTTTYGRPDETYAPLVRAANSLDEIFFT
jgi:FO synthase